MKRLYTVLSIIAFLCAVQPAWAHLLWLNIDNHRPRINETVRIEIGWGHHFPKNEVMKESFLDKVYAVDRYGKKIPLTQTSFGQYEFTPKTEGTYRVLADIHPGFLTKTTQGYKMKPKNGLHNAVSCFRYDLRAKAVISVDGKGEDFDTPAGDLLEIIPLKSPDRLKKGDLFPLKVLYDGNPLANVPVYATYEGFSEESDTIACTIMTDGNGKAELEIFKKGNWMVNVIHKVPYPAPEECDDHNYKYSFTFKSR